MRTQTPKLSKNVRFKWENEKGAPTFGAQRRSLEATACQARETRRQSATLRASRLLSIFNMMSVPNTSKGSLVSSWTVCFSGFFLFLLFLCLSISSPTASYFSVVSGALFCFCCSWVVVCAIEKKEGECNRNKKTMEVNTVLDDECVSAV